MREKEKSRKREEGNVKGVKGEARQPSMSKAQELLSDKLIIFGCCRKCKKNFFLKLVFLPKLRKRRFVPNVLKTEKTKSELISKLV